jgi:protein-tyrosine-phosphatase
MTNRHVQEVRLLSPGAGAKVRRLDEAADVDDPVGMSEEEYLRTARHIQRALKTALDSSPWEWQAPGGRQA